MSRKTLAMKNPGCYRGNLLTVVSVSYYRHLRTPTNIFIVSLAMADLLVAVLVMPFSLVRTVDRWMFGKPVCIAHSLLDMAFCTSSIFSLVCIALDRYLAVCDPLRYSTRMSRRKISCLLLLSWFVPVVVSGPIVALGQVVDEHAKGHGPTKCVFVMTTPFAVLAFTVSFLLPTVFMATAYWKIFMVAQKQVRRINTVENQVTAFQFHPDSTARRERKAAKTLGIILGAYLLCWPPFFIANLAHPLLGSSINSWVMEVVLWLGYANSALNPILYAFFNAAFRHAFANILGCRRCVPGPQDGRLTPPNRSRHMGSEMVTVSG
ncbi:5-hydroxytryptamine receptor 4-like [Brienomyrus brachyistius]|uniref:5-hydroxytryptamine receptor 4-like n=1 Tax=Brienomyrus brachyistius TaxID=42636 RepID=UPI0020B4053D|nr:5-hydroxytryptamine receptor 4-like [Brienomyrus brachyistius]